MITDAGRLLMAYQKGNTSVTIRTKRGTHDVSDAAFVVTVGEEQLPDDDPLVILVKQAWQEALDQQIKLAIYGNSTIINPVGPLNCKDLVP